MSEKLKPCPSCGGPTEIDEHMQVLVCLRSDQFIGFCPGERRKSDRRAPQGEPSEAGASADVEALVDAVLLDRLPSPREVWIRGRMWRFQITVPDAAAWRRDLSADIIAALRSRAGVGEDVKTLYHLRCGWCGAYEGEVDEGEVCPDPTEDDMHPHQFGIYERVARLSGDDQGDNASESWEEWADRVSGTHPGDRWANDPDASQATMDAARAGDLSGFMLAWSGMNREQRRSLLPDLEFFRRKDEPWLGLDVGTIYAAIDQGGES